MNITELGGHGTCLQASLQGGAHPEPDLFRIVKTIPDEPGGKCG
jgi:hypothetical protein